MKRVAFARAIETEAEGKAPHAVRLWRFGWNRTDKGDVQFTERSAELVMAAYERRKLPLVFDYEHESLIALEDRRGPDVGKGATKRATLAIRPDENGKPECWAVEIEWTPEAARQIEDGERRQISPYPGPHADPGAHRGRAPDHRDEDGLTVL